MNRNVFLTVLTAALVLLAACASPAAPKKNDAGDPGASALAGSVDLSMTLHDIYPGTFGPSGDDRNTSAHTAEGPAAYMGLIVWIEDSSGNYVKTIKYFLSDQNTTYGALYEGTWTHVPSTGSTFSDTTSGMARKWTSLYSPAHVSGVNGLDGISAATVFVPSAGKSYTAAWDLKNFNGTVVAAGTYKLKVLVMRHSNKTYGSTEYSYTIPLAVGTDSTGTAEAGFPLAQPGDATNATTDNGVATGITVAFTHS